MLQPHGALFAPQVFVAQHSLAPTNQSGSDLYFSIGLISGCEDTLQITISAVSGGTFSSERIEVQDLKNRQHDSLGVRSLRVRPYSVTALAPAASLAEAVRTHWREYLMEAAELGVLMLGTCFFGVLLYSPQSPLNLIRLSRATKSFLMGTSIALTTFLIIRSPFGRRSGAHFNPAVTLTFLWLRRIHRWDALFYVAAQFAGGLSGVLMARQLLGSMLSSIPVQYVVTLPGSYGVFIAFAAEFALSGLLMGVVLCASNHPVLFRFTPILIAFLTVFYFALCSSISGFSVNPARTFSSAVFAGIWNGLWIYFLAPCAGMLAAATVYIRIMGRSYIRCAKVLHDMHSICPFPCHFDRLRPKNE
jgi:aquaporin Z